ncbi:MAG: DUF6982 domain-containing protein [Candidatus Binatia bacterium]
MAGSLVVAGYRDGRRVKGVTLDFLPTREAFHVQIEEGDVIEILVRELKSVFFVRDLVGDANHRSRNEFDLSATMSGRKIRVVYYDGEELVGTTQGYSAERSGFFVVPADKKSNNQRIFVVAAAATQIHML